MIAHAEILDEKESLKKPFAASVLFHAGVLAFFAIWHVYSLQNKLVIGTSNPGYGSSVAVNPVATIPLPPHRGPVNPVANPTESVVPQHQAEKVQPKQRVPEPPKNAIPLKSRMPEKPVPHDYLLQKYRSQEPRPNQMTSDRAPAASSMMIMKAGSTNGVGVNPNSVVGTQFGGYAQALMEAVARHWNTGGLTGVHVPLAVVTVDILRDGSIRNPHIVQSSGHATVDYSALRAVTEAAPFPHLPPEYSGSVLNVDFQFQLHP